MFSFGFFVKSSFSRNKYKFSVYLTAQRKIEDSQIPEDDEDSNNTLMDSEDVSSVENRRKVH